MTEVEGWSNGDEAVAKENEILRILVGSTMYGTSVGPSDLDYMAVYVNTPEQLMGLAESKDHWTYRTQPEGVRSGRGDIDLVSYSLRKVVRLAVNGNPSVLAPLMAPDEFVVYTTWPGEQLRKNVDMLLCKSHVRRFYSYFYHQVERTRGNGHVAKMPNRAELVKEFGFDVKYASTAIRMALSGIELATTGKISLPLREPDRDLCISIRSGKHTFNEVNEMFDYFSARLLELESSSENVLRDSVDYDKVNRFLVCLTRDYYELCGVYLADW